MTNRMYVKPRENRKCVVLELNRKCIVYAEAKQEV